MKRILCAIAVIIPMYSHADVSLNESWETEGLRVPESVLYYKDGSDAHLFVAEINGEGDEANGEGAIATMSVDGKILNQDWITGLNAPKGMAVHDGKLYVADLTELVVIDIESERLVTRIEVPDSVFLNDVAVDADGTVYVSDTRTNTVHRFVNHLPEVFLEDVESANGLTVADGQLYIAAGTKLLKVGPNNELVELADGIEGGADGLEMVRPNEFIVTGWGGVVYHATEDGELVTLLDTREQEKNTADIGWNPDDKVLYIPTFFSDSVVAYEVELGQ